MLQEIDFDNKTYSSTTTRPSAVSMFVWKVCHSCLMIRLCGPALVLSSWYQMWLWLTPEPCPSSHSSLPHIGHILTTSHWFIGEDCGRAINRAPELCQTKLPLLFLQQSSSNYGFHACVEWRSTIWRCFVTVTCLSGWTRNKVHSKD